MKNNHTDSLRKLLERGTQMLYLRSETMAALNAVEELEAFIPDKNVEYTLVLTKTFKMDLDEFKKSKLFALIGRTNVHKLHITLFGNFKIATLLVETCRPKELQIHMRSKASKKAQKMIKFKNAILGCKSFERFTYTCETQSTKKGFDFKFLKELKVGFLRYNLLRETDFKVAKSELKGISKMSMVENFLLSSDALNSNSSELIKLVYDRIPKRMKCQKMKITNLNVTSKSNYKEALTALKKSKIPSLTIVWIFESKDDRTLNAQMRGLSSFSFPEHRHTTRISKASFRMELISKECIHDVKESGFNFGRPKHSNEAVSKRQRGCNAENY